MLLLPASPRRVAVTLARPGSLSLRVASHRAVGSGTRDGGDLLVVGVRVREYECPLVPLTPGDSALDEGFPGCELAWRGALVP